MRKANIVKFIFTPNNHQKGGNQGIPKENYSTVPNRTKNEVNLPDVIVIDEIQSSSAHNSSSSSSDDNPLFPQETIVLEKKYL